MPIKAVIWDIGGVIMRTEDQAPRAELAEELGVTRVYLNELVFDGEQGTRAQIGEISRMELWDYVRSELQLAPGEYPDLHERFFGGDVLDTDLVDFIRSLKPRFKIGIISNAWSQIEEALVEWGINDAFEVVVGSGDVGIMKPDPRIFQIALERLSVEPSEAVFVDDFIQNVSGAQALGIAAIRFQSRDQVIRELEQLLDL
jgi:epoxide hydrolase-like predicted phosphatase